MIDYTEIDDGDAWEAFAHDYLMALGLVVDVPPGRGPDGGRDMLVKETLKGKLASQSFTWLVSCKHYATSGKAVGTEHETNIIDRLAQHKADGFIGFYSTMASAALIERLKDLRDQRKIAEFKIYDGSHIETGFHDVGLSGVLLKRLPASHTALRPIHPLLGKYQPLECEICGTDLLKRSVKGENLGVMVFGHSAHNKVETLHFVCRDECDRKMSARVQAQGLTDGWNDISDFCNPLIYLRHMIAFVNETRKDSSRYSEAAHSRMLDLFLAVSQRTLRQTNVEDRQAYFDADMLARMGV
ncbi:restriction endonuclease [Sinorhizobium meliloti]|uniref:restriction endonuclease n=1 Tax=Rhizobium meliloti TaxID=382 RepID=UPI0018E73459|nr:restriction endonuclease [Sinorhizobium meliloti]QQF06228.1 restriction endonuclease [Sinorhizobium meliloti]